MGGFTADIKEDKAKFQVVTKRIRGLLTHRRNQLETLVSNSECLVLIHC